MKFLALLLITFILYLGYDTYYGRNGVAQYFQAKKQYLEASMISESLEKRNQNLREDIADLKQGNKIVEDIARTDLGMVKQNETFYRVIEKDSQSKKQECFFSGKPSYRRYRPCSRRWQTHATFNP